MVNHKALTLAMASLISFFAIVGNSVMIITFFLRSHLRSSTANWLTVSSFVAGVFAGIYYPFLGLVDAFIVSNNPFCFIVVSMGAASGLQFTMSVGAMTVERYISICHPLHAARIITQRRVTFVISSIYIYSLIIIALPAMTPLGYRGDLSDSHLGCRLATVYNLQYGNFVVVQYLAPVPIMIITYCRIFFVLRRHIRAIAIAPTNITETVGPGAAVDLSNAAVLEDATRKRLLWKREMRSVTLLCTLVMMYALPWIPFVVLLQYAYSSGFDGSPVAYSIIHTLVFVCVGINPFLYGFGNKAFREAILSVFCRRQIHIPETITSSV